MSINCFSQAAIEGLNHYVYCLVDPRDKRIFYIGEGQGNRVFDHVNARLDDIKATDKIDTIREIISEKLSVEHYILRHNLTADEAYNMESLLIDLFTYEPINTESVLTNLVAGHHQWSEGIKTVDEIEQLYNYGELQLQQGHKLLLVNLNRSYNIKSSRTGMRERPNLYEITRGSWLISKTRADKVDYVLGVYKGIVRCVIEPSEKKWQLAGLDQKGRKRYLVEGECDGHDGCRLYMNKVVPSSYKFPSRGAIRYVE